MEKSDQAITPREEGPGADPALLANAGNTLDANVAGFCLAVDAMQKFGRELEQLPTEGRKFVEQALSSISSSNSKSTRTASNKSSRSNRAEKDSFVRIVNTLADLSPSETNAKAIIETFVLSSLVLTVFSLSSLIGGYLLAPFITLVIPPVGAAVFSALIAPSAVYYQLSKGYSALDGLRLLVAAASVQGVLSGAALSHFTVESEPLIALSSIASSFAIAMMGPESRISAHIITVSTSILSHLSIGALEGYLSPVYLVLTGLYTLAALIPIQLATRDRKRANVNLYSAVLVGITIASKCFVYGISGMSDTPASAGQEFGAAGSGDLQNIS